MIAAWSVPASSRFRLDCVNSVVPGLFKEVPAIRFSGSNVASDDFMMPPLQGVIPAIGVFPENPCIGRREDVECGTSRNR